MGQQDLGVIYGVVLGIMLFGVILVLGTTGVLDIISADSNSYTGVNTTYLSSFSGRGENYISFGDNLSRGATDTVNNVSASTNSIDEVKITAWGAVKATLAAPIYVMDAISLINENNQAHIPPEILSWIVIAILLTIIFVIIAILWYR